MSETAPAATPEDPPAAGRFRDVRIRLLAAPLVLGGVLAVLWSHDATGNPLGTDLLFAAGGAAAGVEMALLLGRRTWPCLVHAALWTGLLAGVGLFWPNSAALRFELRVLLVAGALIWLLLRHLRDVGPESVGRIVSALAPPIYVGLLFSFTRELAFGPDGARRLIWIVLVAKASDIGGWAVGRFFGRHKMIPSVSPGKSWEGTAGGLAASVLVAVFLPAFLGIAEAAWSVPARIGFGLLLAAASILAGVTQSGWKRRVGAKDSSPLIPEMGGVLDMLDSLLLAAPAAYLVYRLTGAIG